MHVTALQNVGGGWGSFGVGKAQQGMPLQKIRVSQKILRVLSSQYSMLRKL